ncbi:MAG: hydrogenase iron-sulfur subunit [Thermoproteota archaeon]
MSKENEQIRIGVFVCHCGNNIAGTIDCKAVADYAKSLKDVVYSVDNLYTCSEAGQAELKKAIVEHNLNRVVVASCSPKMHEITFRNCVSEAGLNPFLMEMANIREHNSWVHASDPKGATEKAMDQVRMAVSKARLLKPLQPIRVPITKRALVLGGGVAGMTAALNIADSGHDVILVEKEASLGGMASLLDKTFPNVDCTSCQLQELINRVTTNPRIKVLTLSEVKEISGYVGNFDVKILRRPTFVNDSCTGCGLCLEACPEISKDEILKYVRRRKPISLVSSSQVPRACTNSSVWDRNTVHIKSMPTSSRVVVIDKNICNSCGACAEVCPERAIELEQPSIEESYKVGAIVLAIGLDLFDPSKKPEYGYLRLRDVITSLELERMLSPIGPTQGKIMRPSDGKAPKRVAFIQCVGCRDDTTNPYCGRICCLITLKQAILLKDRSPDVEITIFYIDVRTGGKEYEALYTKAQQLACRFIRGRPSGVVDDGNHLVVRSEDTLRYKSFVEGFDLVVLATGIEPPKDARIMSEMLKVPLDPYGFFMEAHIKLKPAETVVDGVMLAGSCSGPMDIPSSISRGHASASKVISLFSRDEIELEPIVSHIDPNLCKGCLACTKVCPFQAVRPLDIDGGKKVKILESLCKGCGTCVAGCPYSALDQYHFSEEQINAQIDSALEKDPSDKIISFNCNWCSYAGADFAGVSRLQYPTNVRIIRVMCSGRVSIKMILRAFEKGAGMVLIAPCHPADCHYISGNAWAKKRVEQAKNMLSRRGINPERLWFVYVSAAEGNVYQRTIIEMTSFLEKMKRGEESWGGEKILQGVRT